MAPTRLRIGALLLFAAALASHSDAMAGEQAQADNPKHVYHDQHGDALPPDALARLGTTRLFMGQWYRTAVFSPNGKVLASSGFASEGDPEAIRLWDVATGKEIGRFPGDSNDLAFSPDGDRLAVSHEMSELCLYDVISGEELWSWDAHSEKASPKLAGVAFSPDGKTLAVAVGDHTVRLCETTAGKEASRLKAKATGLVFAPDGKTLASFDFMGKTVSLWDPATGKRLQTLGNSATVSSLAFAPDGLSLTVHSGNGKDFLWDVARGKMIRQMDAPGVDEPRAAALSRALAALERHGGPIRFVAPSADGKTIRTVGVVDHTIREWEASGKSIRRIDTPPWQDFLALSSDGDVLATPKWDKEFVLVEGKSGQTITEGGPRPDPVGVGAMALSADGNRLAVLSGKADRVVRLWDADAGKKLLALQGKIDGPGSLAFSPDGKVLAVAASLDRLSLWDTATGKPLEGPVWAAKKRTYPFDGSIDPEPHGVIGFGPEDLKAQPSPAAGLLFSPSGKTLAVMSGYQREHNAFFDPPDAGLVRLYDVTTGKERFQLSSQEAVAAFSPDGKTLATGGHPDFAVYLWDATTGKQRARFKGHRGEITALAFAADGATLISGSADGTALVWRVSGKGR